MKMKGFAMLGIGKTGWIQKEVPACGPLDAIVRPLAVSPCTSDIHTAVSYTHLHRPLAHGQNRQFLSLHLLLHQFKDVVVIAEMCIRDRPGTCRQRSEKDRPTA